MPRVSALIRYPVKSCRGIPCLEVEVSTGGLLGDRAFLIVDETGRFLTQREHPGLARIVPEPQGTRLRLRAPGSADLEIDAAFEGPPRPAQIWRDTVPAHDLGEGAAAWLTAYLRTPCRLVRMGHDAPSAGESTAKSRTSFVDSEPLLVISEESLEDLNARLPSPLPMDRFRPNLVVAESEAYAEDTWRRMRIGSLEFSAVKPCTRCTITTVDQETGIRGTEPLATLARYRRTDGGKAAFGIYFRPRSPGRLRVGDPVEGFA